MHIRQPPAGESKLLLHDGRTVCYVELIALAAGATLGVLLIFFITVVKSVHRIGPTQVGLVTKRFGRKLPDDNPIAFKGEAGHQADLLMPGMRMKLWPIYTVAKLPWVQNPNR